MNTPTENFIMRNTVFAWITLGTVCALLIPWIAMQYTTEVNWSLMDFVAMAGLLMITGCLFVLAARKVPHKYWLALGILFAIIFVYVWAELAVGVFTNLGS